jgi:hypothetical protein
MYVGGRRLLRRGTRHHMATAVRVRSVFEALTRSCYKKYRAACMLENRKKMI